MLGGRYRIGQVIGRGGMSTVHEARDTVLDRAVAVKVLLPALAEGDPTHVARFEREARAAAALQHPAVVKIYDTGRDGQTHFIVMELVSGQSVEQLLKAGRALDPDEATRVAGRVAGALAAAHAAGILHRDVKPANVMLTPAGEVKVLDFGIARARQDPTVTQPTFAIGTAAYMSPERIVGRPGDERSDIYSLGCLLYAMLTGHPPFAGEDVLSVLHQHVHQDPVPPRRWGAPIAPPLEALVLAMLAKDPADRPQTAAEVAGRLAEHPQIARPAGPARAAPAAFRRRALGAAALVACLGVALALALGGSGQSRLASGHLGEPGGRAARATPHQVLSTPSTPAIVTILQPAPGPAAPPGPRTPPGHDDGPGGHHHEAPPGHKDKPPKPPKPGKGDGGD
jgi:serine/threonine-protein kinase